MKKLSSFCFLFFLSLAAVAQPGNGVDMADELRKSGKIYVVVLTIAIIFVGLAIYLFTMDRRLKKLERGDK